MNEPLSETSKEHALRLLFTPPDDFALALAKVKNPKVLKELYHMAHQKDNLKMMRMIMEHSKANNIPF
jgi:hypothetical protein